MLTENSKLSTLLNAAKIAAGFKRLPESDVKHILKLAAGRWGHFAYEFFLSRYDSGIHFPDKNEIAKRTFIGRGYGAGTLDTYRKIEMLNGTAYFEKIYFKNSIDFKKMRFFFDHVYDKLAENRVTTPFYYSIVEGRFFSVVNFSFVELKYVDPDHYEKYAIKISHAINTTKLDSIDKKYDYLFEMEHCIMFQIGINVLNQMISSDIVIKKQFQTVYFYILNQNRTLQHGDLNLNNIYYNCVLDWDEFGMYPECYDLGYILTHGLRLRGIFFNLDHFNAIIDEYSLTNVVNLLFFIIVFSCKYDLFEHKEELIKCIKKLHYLYKNRLNNSDFNADIFTTE